MDEDNIVAEFKTYEGYLDSKITSLDLYYLEATSALEMSANRKTSQENDVELARQLAELGCLRNGEVLKREEFEARKQAAEASRISKQTQQKTLASAGKELQDPFLKQLAKREEANRSGKMATIIFIRDTNSRGQEISAYIDYGHRLELEDFEPYFLGKKRLLPRPSDLSFYNWKKNKSTSNSSPNYEVITQISHGLLFKNKRDRKIVNVDPYATSPGDNSIRTVLSTPKYLQVVLYDHMTRRKI